MGTTPYEQLGSIISKHPHTVTRILNPKAVDVDYLLERKDLSGLLYVRYFDPKIHQLSEAVVTPKTNAERIGGVLKIKRKVFRLDQDHRDYVKHCKVADALIRCAIAMQPSVLCVILCIYGQNIHRQQRTAADIAHHNILRRVVSQNTFPNIIPLRR